MSLARIAAVMLLTSLLIGCEKTSLQGRYQILTAPDGRVLRLDSVEGHVFVVEKDVLVRIPDDAKLSLSVGRVYKFEDERWMKYLGNGQFEPAQKVTSIEDLRKKYGLPPGKEER